MKDIENHKRLTKEWKENNKNKVKAHNKKWETNNPEKLKESRHNYYIKNKEKLASQNKLYRETNKDILLSKKKERQKLARKIDKKYRTLVSLRNRLYIALKKYSKTGKIMSSQKYGIDYGAIIEHLKPFPEELSKYHIDHIRPLCSFNLNDPEEIKKAFAPENHQWLLAKDNLMKGGKFQWP